MPQVVVDNETMDKLWELRNEERRPFSRIIADAILQYKGGEKQ